MEHVRSIALSGARLGLAVLALVLVTGAEAQATDGQGGCSAADPGWYCATASSFEGTSYCIPGQSGGCETCHHTGDTDDKCFYSGGPKHTGYKAEAYPGA